MRKKSTLAAALVFFLSAPASALAGEPGELRVTVNMAAGQTPVEFRLGEEESRTFLQRWDRLPLSERMVPLSNGNGYAGLIIRQQEDSRDIRLFNGVGVRNGKSHEDEFRLLERWVLSKAPPPLGPALLAALDREVREQSDVTGTQPPSRAKAPPSSQQLILDCRWRAKGNHRLRALCLEDTLKQQLDMKAYADGLEKIAGSQLPVRP